MKRLLPLAALTLTACAPQTYRIALREAVPVLIPPRVQPTRTSATIKTPGGTNEAGKCPAQHYTTAQLTAAPAGFLTTRAAELQAAGCLPPGQGAAYAARVLHQLPLPLEVRQRLIQPPPASAGYLDLQPGYRLRVVSPVLRAGAAPGELLASTSTTTQAPNGVVNVNVQVSSNVLGYEIAHYTVRDAIQPLGAQLHQDGKTTQSATSRYDYFRFAPDARLYRMLFLTRASNADRDALLVAAPTESALEAATRDLNAEPARCQTPAYQGRCIVLPPGVAVTASVAVMVNGTECLVPPGATVLEALRQAAQQAEPATARTWQPPPPSRIQVTLNGSAVPVIHTPAAAAPILRLPLNGGETINVLTDDQPEGKRRKRKE